MNAFTVRHINTYIADTACVQHINVGLAQARPNKLVPPNTGGCPTLVPRPFRAVPNVQ